MSWWEAMGRADVLAAVRALLAEGGCLVLEGDRQSGRAQAATLAAQELARGGFEVHRLEGGATTWTVYETLVEAWHLLRGEPADDPGLACEAEIAGRPIPWLAQELAAMLASAATPTALVLEDLDRDGARDYDFRRVFHPIARQSHRPVVVTYDPNRRRWPNRADVLRLSDFSREEVQDCVLASSLGPSLSARELGELVEIVFGGRVTPAATVRPLIAYSRLQDWQETSR